MPPYNKAGRLWGSGTTSQTRQAKRLAHQAATAAAEAASQAAQAVKAAHEAAEAAAALKKAAGLDAAEAQVRNLEQAAEAAVEAAAAAQAAASASQAAEAQEESQTAVTLTPAAHSSGGSHLPPVAEANSSTGLAPVAEALAPVPEAPVAEALAPVAETVQEGAAKEDKKEEKLEEVKEEKVEADLEKGSNLEKGEKDAKRKEPESGFVSNLHKNKGREVPKAAAKSPDSSRSSSICSRADYGRSSSEPSSAPASPLAKEKDLEKGDKVVPMYVEDPMRQPQGLIGSLASKSAKPKVTLLLKLPGMVAVDWFKTVEQPNGELDTNSLKKLKDNAVKVWIVKAQAKKVRQKCAHLQEDGLVEGCTCVSERCGQWGKTSLCKQWGLYHLFDDAEDICLEAAAAGLHVYPLLAGKMSAHSRLKGQYGVEPFWDLGDAVSHFLKSHREAFQ